MCARRYARGQSPDAQVVPARPLRPSPRPSPRPIVLSELDPDQTSLTQSLKGREAGRPARSRCSRWCGTTRPRLQTLYRFAADGGAGAPRSAPARRAARARAARNRAAARSRHWPSGSTRLTCPTSDPIEDATVLVAGRGRGYPALTVAVGERMGLIGALSIETARSYLGARDIDGVVIGDGFNRADVEDFVEELARRPALARPAGDRAARCGARTRSRAHAERRPGRAATRRPSRRTSCRSRGCTPSRARLKRIAASLDQKGVLAPDTGLLTAPPSCGELAARRR